MTQILHILKMVTVPSLFAAPRKITGAINNSLCAHPRCQNSNVQAVAAQLLLVIDPAALHFPVLCFSQVGIPMYRTCCFSNCFVIRSSHMRCPLHEGSKSVHSVFEHVAVVVLLGLAAMVVNAGFTTA